MSIAAKLLKINERNTNYSGKEPMVIDAVTTAPTKGTTDVDYVIWRRVGDCAIIRYEYKGASGGGGSAGSGHYLFKLPGGLIANSDKIELHTGTNLAQGQCGWGYSKDDPGNGRFGVCAMYDSTHFRVQLLDQSNQNIHSNTFQGIANDTFWSYMVVVPILGWS
jgi:hypothetical protein